MIDKFDIMLRNAERNLKIDIRGKTPREKTKLIDEFMEKWMPKETV